MGLLPWALGAGLLIALSSGKKASAAAPQTPVQAELARLNAQDPEMFRSFLTLMNTAQPLDRYIANAKALEGMGFPILAQQARGRHRELSLKASKAA